MVTFASYLIISIISYGVGRVIFVGFYLFADLEFLAGTIFGVVYALKNRQSDETLLKYGAIVGVMGGIISSILISLYEMVVLSVSSGPSITIFFIYLGISIISGIAIGSLGGALLGTYFTYKATKEETVEEETIGDDFFDDLIEK